MFKLFRRNRTRELFVRAEDLQVGDMMSYSLGICEVLDVIQHDQKTTLRLVSTHPSFRCDTRQVDLYNELMCPVTRSR